LVYVLTVITSAVPPTIVEELVERSAVEHD
jgi:hypothetical protein